MNTVSNLKHIEQPFDVQILAVNQKETLGDDIVMIKNGINRDHTFEIIKGDNFIKPEEAENFKGQITQICCGIKFLFFLDNKGILYGKGKIGKFGFQKMVQLPQSNFSKIEDFSFVKNMFASENILVLQTSDYDFTILRYSEPDMKTFNMPKKIISLAVGSENIGLILEDGSYWRTTECFPDVKLIKIEFSRNCQEIFAGFFDFVVLDDEGIFWIFRDNEIVPMEIKFQSKGIKAAGGLHWLFLLENGDVYSMGFGLFGQLGRNSLQKDHDKSYIIPLNFKASNIFAGVHLSCILDSDGNMYMFGRIQDEKTRKYIAQRSPKIIWNIQSNNVFISESDDIVLIPKNLKIYKNYPHVFSNVNKSFSNFQN